MGTGANDGASIGGYTPPQMTEQQKADQTDPGVTHTRGRIDDLTRNLGWVRLNVHTDTWEHVAGRLDDVDKLVELLRDELEAAQLDTPNG